MNTDQWYIRRTLRWTERQIELPPPLPTFRLAKNTARHLDFRHFNVSLAHAMIMVQQQGDEYLYLFYE